MLPSPISGLAAAAETRRRELPASIALVILTGGVAAAIMGGVGAVGWAAIVSLLLVFDAELYRRLDAADAKLRGRVRAGLAGWAFLNSAFYATLPIALWNHGAAAGAAAAMVLWVAGVVRHFSPGASGGLVIAVAGAAPPALALLVAPLVMAAASARPDWDLAVIAAIGGGALMAYVTQARVSAEHAERALRETAQGENMRHTLAELMFEQGPLAIVLTDVNGRVVAMSKAMQRGLNLESPIGRAFEDLVPWPPRRWRDALARVLLGEQVSYEEDETHTANGTAWYSWDLSPWLNADGEICGAIAHGRDATSLVQMRASAASLHAARDAADAANVSKSHFLASMSHELRTPLNAIIGYSEILMEEAEADERANDIKDIDRVLGAARQLLHLINDILDLSKIEAGRMVLVASDFDVSDLIREAAETIAPAIDKNRNTLALDIAPDLGGAHSDAFKLNQCLLNLLSNAAKFTHGGVINVRARRERAKVGSTEPDRIVIEVADSGIGMNEAQVARLFSAFVQAEASTAQVYGGTGLGLAITRRTMQLLGGDVAVTSAPGEGSTFSLRWPAQAPAQAAPARIDVAAAVGAGRERLVLLIDDEESARDLAARSLARLGFVARGGANGREGIALARKIKPSLIVLDINLPDMTGWNVLEALKASPDTASIPVVVHSVNDDRQRALALGACAHLVKPADRDVLAAAVLRFARAPAEIFSEPATPAFSAQSKTA
jgi:PAS domain S-box-containing protein